MIESSHHLALPLIAAGQAQKHVTHNEALTTLDALVQLAVAGRRSVPPEPTAGMRVIVEPGSSGVFAGHDAAIACVRDGAWAFAEPRPGWRAWIEDETRLCVFDGSDWQPLPLRDTDRLGIAAEADDTNRLAVASEAVLFGHVGAGTQVKLNKAAPADTASLLFQTDFSGRAEIGLPGEDELAFKISEDGTSWHEAARFSPTTSRLSGRREDVGNDVTFHVARPGGPVGVTVEVNSDTGVTLADFALQTELHTVAFRNEGRSAQTLSGTAPEFQVRFPPPFGSSPLGITPELLLANAPLRLRSYTVATLPAPAAAGPGALAHVTDAPGGAVPAFSDGTNWRTVTDRTVLA